MNFSSIRLITIVAYQYEPKHKIRNFSRSMKNCVNVDLRKSDLSAIVLHLIEL